MLFKPATGDYNTLFTLSLVPKYCCLDTLSAPRQERCMNSPFCYCKLPLSAALLGSQKFKVSFVLSSTTLFKQFVTARERKKKEKKKKKEPTPRALPFLQTTVNTLCYKLTMHSFRQLLFLTSYTSKRSLILLRTHDKNENILSSPTHTQTCTMHTYKQQDRIFSVWT